MNQDEIATRFCVNKEKVSMNCKGCCHLAQQLESMDHDKGEQLPSGLPTVPEDPFEYFLDSEQKLKFPISFSMKLTEKSIVPFLNPHIPGVPHPPPEV